MLKTDLNEFEKDLIEEIDLFGNHEDFNIRHFFKEDENKLTNTIVVNGTAYAFGNLVKKTEDAIFNTRIKKRYAKLSLYKALSRYMGKTMPWGSLTGIRPVKLAYGLIEETGEFEDYFINTLKVDCQKTDIVKRVIEAQKNYYVKDDDNCDFFVFIPFCPSRCSYCSFICEDIKNYSNLVDKYVDTLIYEIKQSIPLVKKLRSIYIGGGTPVSLSDRNLDKVLSAIDEINDGVEYTVEAGRPDCITSENLKILKSHGVTRICINPQSLNDEVLKNIGRKHSGSDVIEKFELAKDDFSINMDFIAGLKGESLNSFKKGIDKAITLSPDNITVHTLCVKKGAEIAKQSNALVDDEVEKMVEYARNALTVVGYNPYYLYRQKYMKNNLENIGYSKPGKECVYNIDTMEEISSTVACGANGISKRVFNSQNRIERVASAKNVATYLEKINATLERKAKLFD